MIAGAMSVSIPAWLLLLFFAILGLTFGSFATALIYRVPISESLNTRSKCTQCSRQLCWHENIPVFSYLALRGKCSGCESKISWIYPAVEITMVALFLLPLFMLNSWIAIFLWLALAIVGVPLFIIDLQHHRLPDLLTGSLFGAALLVVLEHSFQQNHYDRIAPSLIGAGSLVIFYLLLLVISRGGMGMGDVKLSAGIGLISGYFGLRAVLASSYIAFSLGAFIGIALMLLGKAGRKTAIPFGPFMIAGQFISLVIYAH